MAKVESFDGLISSIQEAFLSVNRMAEHQHLEAMNEFFDDNGNPLTIKVQCPYFNESGEPEYRSIEIPQICLVPVSSLKLNEITVDFKVKLSTKITLGNNNKQEKNALLRSAVPQIKEKEKMGFIPEYRRNKNNDSYANITLKFLAEEPPEGVLRIRDEMIKILP